MSFSRAKVTRFNEAVSHTPSPADYNVKLETSSKAGLLLKAERFDGKSPAHIENSNSVHSAPATPHFRTPNVPKKKKTIFNLTSRKTKPTDLFSKKQKKDIITHDDQDELDLEALKDKIVECNNKDVFIKDLTEQIEEMKEHLNDLERQKQILTKEKCKLEENCKEMREDHRIMMENAFLQYDSETLALKNEIHKLEGELIVEQEALKTIQSHDNLMKIEINEKLAVINAASQESKEWAEREIAEKQKLVEMLQTEIFRMEAEIEELEQKHEAQISDLQQKHKDDVMGMEFVMLKSITEAQNKLEEEKITFEKRLTTLRNQHEKETKKILHETTAKIKQMEEDSKEASLLADIQMQEKCNDMERAWRMSLDEQRSEADAILKECQAISEYSISQTEWEKNEIKNELNRKMEDLKQFERDNADLNIALQETEMKYSDLKKDLNGLRMTTDIEMQKYKSQLQEMQQQKKLYEISITKAHDIIETLKKRLLHSDHDVEQLKAELETCEANKLESEARCTQFKDQLDQVGKRTDALDEEYHDSLKKTDDHIAVLEIELIEKVESYKAEALKQVDELVEQLQQKQYDLDETLVQLHNEHSTNKKAFALIELANDKIEAQHQENDELVANLENVKVGFVKVQMQMEENELKISSLALENNQLRQRLSEMGNANDTLVSYQQQHAEIDGLVKQLQQIQEKSDSYSQYCEYYKRKASEYEMEIDELEGINKKYIEQSGKYDTLLQQHEKLLQRCKELEKITPQVIDCEFTQLHHTNYYLELKKKNFELVEENKNLQSTLKSHTKTIEKLSKQLSTIQLHSPRKGKIHASDKENVASPNRSRVESPVPLKERN